MTGAMTLFGLSGQLKYSIDLPETGNRGKVVLQGGFGFAQATHRGSDASSLIPPAATLDWALTHQQAFTATFLLSFTNLESAPDASAHVRPALLFGVRF